MNNEEKNIFKKIKKYLPDTKILILFIVLISIFIALLIFKDKIFSDKDNNNKDLSKITLKAIKGMGNNAIDTDGDGISDFEEKLNGTDINKRDTDGDGISDFLEKKLGTDPNVKREFDPVVKKEIERMKKNETVTDKAISDLLKQIVINKDRKLTDDDGVMITKTVYEKNIPKNVLKIKYNLKNIKYADQITVKQYKNSFISAGTVLDKKGVNVQAMIARYIAYPDSVGKKVLDNTIKILREYEKEVLNMKVPTLAKDNHLRYLNSFSMYIDTIEGISNSLKSDPIMAMAYLQRMDAAYEIFIENKTILNKLYFR